MPGREGWLLVLRPADPSELDALMSAEAYGAKVNAMNLKYQTPLDVAKNADVCRTILEHRTGTVSLKAGNSGGNLCYGHSHSGRTVCANGGTSVKSEPAHPEQ